MELKTQKNIIWAIYLIIFSWLPGCWMNNLYYRIFSTSSFEVGTKLFLILYISQSAINLIINLFTESCKYSFSE